jgi:hypothetical protein
MEVFKMATERTAGRNLLVTLPLAAFCTSLFLLCLFPAFPRALFLLGMGLGIVVGRILANANVLRGNWAWIVVAWVTAQFLSMLVVGIVQLFSSDPAASDWSNPPPLSPVALAAGGLMGALPIVGVLSLLRRTRPAFIVAQALLGMASGGILAVAGWTLTPSLGTSLCQLLGPRNSIFGPRLPANFLYSMLLIWPTGMALVTALTVRGLPDNSALR